MLKRLLCALAALTLLCGWNMAADGRRISALP